jgi:hypothetical protein
MWVTCLRSARTFPWRQPEPWSVARKDPQHLVDHEVDEPWLGRRGDPGDVR